MSDNFIELTDTELAALYSARAAGNQPTDSEQSLTTERGNLRAGATGASATPNVDPYVAAQRAMDLAVGAGRTSADALAEGIGTILQAGVNGDPRVLRRNGNPARS